MKHTRLPRTRVSPPAKFDLRAATGIGGAGPLLDFALRALRLPRLFRTHVAIEKADWCQFPMPTTLTVLALGALLGTERMMHFAEWEQEPLLRRCLGLDKLPDWTTLQYDLHRFTTVEQIESLRAVNPEVLGQVLAGQEFVILDLDSTVLTAYGSQEGAEVGYNPHKRGRRGYHPLLAFDGISGAWLDVILRPGDAHTAEGTVAFYRQAEAQAGRKVRFVRADCGFSNEEFYAHLEQQQVGYTIKMRVTTPLLSHAGETGWQEIASDTEIIQGKAIFYRATTWSRVRRVVLIRRRERWQPGELRQLRLAGLEWEYEAIVTNLDWPSTEDVWHFYNQRCAAEKYIRAAKEDLAIAALPTGGFYPNYAHLLLKMIAYNVYRAFAKVALPGETARWTLGRTRRLLWEIAGILVRHARRTYLRLAAHHPWADVWRRMQQRVAALAAS